MPGLGIPEEVREPGDEDRGRLPRDVLGRHEGRCSTMIEPQLEPDLDACHDLTRRTPLEVDEQPPGLVVHALADLIEETEHGRHGVTSAVLLVEPSRDHVPEWRRAPLLAGLLEEPQQRLMAAGKAAFLFGIIIPPARA